VRGLQWALGQPIDFCGNLKKRQARIGGFAKRYFELRGAALVYYSRPGTPARGFIDLSGARIRESREYMVRPRGYAECALFIDAAPRAFTLFPKTSAEASTWLEVISKAISHAQVSSYWRAMSKSEMQHVPPCLSSLCCPISILYCFFNVTTCGISFHLLLISQEHIIPAVALSDGVRLRDGDAEAQLLARMTELYSSPIKKVGAGLVATASLLLLANYHCEEGSQYRLVH
jgi:hypothetical protein